VVGTFAFAGTAQADYVCNAKTKFVNVFLAPPKIKAYAPDPVWRPGSMLAEPFEIVDTLHSGARIISHGLTEDRAWVWISFRHSQNGLRGNGFVHVGKLSPIPCDADPKDAERYLEAAQLGDAHGDYFESDGEPDDLPLEGARGAKQFETRMLSGAINKNLVFFPCQQPEEGFDATRSNSANAEGEIRGDALETEPRIQACSRLLAINPNYGDALITRGDIYHAFAKTPSRGLDKKSPKWAQDVKRRRDAQQKAIADWTRASQLLPRNMPRGMTALGNRLEPGGPVSYQVEAAP
jgi:hypothetical protein